MLLEKDHDKVLFVNFNELAKLRYYHGVKLISAINLSLPLTYRKLGTTWSVK